MRDVGGQTARGGVSRHHRLGVGQTLSLQLRRQHLGKRIAQLAQRLGRQLFHKQFNQQVLCTHAQATFFCNWATHSGGAMGKPSRSRLS